MASSKAERARLSRLYHHLYSPHSFEGQNTRECFYCGDPAEARDHCPPLQWVETQSKDYWKREQQPFVTVPVCTQCNSYLGSKKLFSLKERAEYVEQKLSAKFDRDATLWSEEEIAEMGPSFQKSLRARQTQISALARRVQYAQARCIAYNTFP